MISLSYPWIPELVLVGKKEPAIAAPAREPGPDNIKNKDKRDFKLETPNSWPIVAGPKETTAPELTPKAIANIIRRASPLAGSQNTSGKRPDNAKQGIRELSLPILSPRNPGRILPNIDPALAIVRIYLVILGLAFILCAYEGKKNRGGKSAKKAIKFDRRNKAK